MLYSKKVSLQPPASSMPAVRLPFNVRIFFYLILPRIAPAMVFFWISLVPS
jgi:hypothetical protein